jgi:hypothetical protein
MLLTTDSKSELFTLVGLVDADLLCRLASFFHHCTAFLQYANAFTPICLKTRALKDILGLFLPKGRATVSRSNSRINLIN